MLGLTLGPAVASAQDRYADLESCELAAAGGRITASARCGTLAVPENPTAPEGRQLELAYAVLPARASNAAPDPVFFLAGGPGQSAREMLPFMRHALREINAERDLIFLDQRGTGESNPLNCDSEQTEEVWLDANYDQMAEQIDACRATWDADLRFYTTSDAARDLESLRIHYGFEQINLIGGSYGTRLAQVYLRNYPDQVRTVILDGVVPTRLHLGSEHGIMLDRALGKLFDLCASDTTCDSTFPDLGSAFDSLKARFPDPDRGPQIQVTHPRRGVAVEMPFNRSTLAAALRFLAYSPQTQMMIPYLVHEASTTGDPTRLASQAMIVTDQMADAIAIGLNFAVGCAEDWPGWPEVDGQADTLLGNSMKIVYDQICADWPSAEAPDDFHVPFDTSTPVLLLSGELDPVTPPSYGDEAAAQYSNSLHLVAQGRGHIVITEDCIGQIASRFVKAADLSSLDAQCMDGLGPEPFFIDLLGPTP
ncbi:MAG: alpha/beta fold hydrolase [Wenzhouxiangella sp.]|jgi:pimeloyl-ACP methyl ester carboxylesterase|nr:alpha/beta fold hydrolase [Wenzhouxiangella sp.]